MSPPLLSDARIHPSRLTMLPPYPLMRVLECEFLESHLKPYHTMLKWGSGFSTVRFSQQVDKYYSIEHNEEWRNKIEPIIESNVHYYHIEGAQLPNGEERSKTGYKYDDWHRPATHWDKIEGSLRDQQFHDYIHSVELFEQIFDVVLIDGRARCECARAVIPFVHHETLIFFHDWNRPQYHIIKKQYKVMETVQRLALLRLKP